MRLLLHRRRKRRDSRRVILFWNSRISPLVISPPGRRCWPVGAKEDCLFFARAIPSRSNSIFGRPIDAVGGSCPYYHLRHDSPVMEHDEPSTFASGRTDSDRTRLRLAASRASTIENCGAGGAS